MQLFCEVPDGLWYPCYGTIFALPEGRPVFHQRLPANCPHWVSLPAGDYRIRVRNTVGLNPGGFSQWFHLEEGHQRCMRLIFGAADAPKPPTLITVTITDAHYPGIIPINGGITVWQQPITP